MDCDWLKSKFFAGVFKERDELKGKSYSISVLSVDDVVEVGDNYAALVIRANVSATVEDSEEKVEDSFIVKCMDNSKYRGYGLFEIELESYQIILPSFERLWRDEGFTIQFSPKCLNAIWQDHEIFILQDMKPCGYFMEDRVLGLNLKQAKLTLNKLAKFHAASIAYKEKFGEFPPHLSRTFNKSFYKSYQNRITPMVNTFREVVEKIGIPTKYLKKINMWTEFLFTEEQQFARDPKCDPNELKVMVHGDLWLNNQLFKRDENGNPVDVIFLDFQVMFWGRPASDLYYFLISSVKPNVIIDHFLDLLLMYYYSLVDSMEILIVKQKPPTLEEFLDEMDRYGFLATICLVEVLPGVLLKRNEEATPETTNKIMSKSEKMIRNTKYVESVKLLLPFFEERGFLDGHIED